MKSELWIFLFIIVSLTSCKSDQKSIDEAEAKMDAEQIYFQDYEEPSYKWGFIDTLGNKSITNKYDAARPFHDGLAIVNFKGKWGMIDKKDEVVIDFDFRSLFQFNAGLARFQNFDQKYGFINKEGETVIPATFDEADDFHEGLAKVSVNGLYQYINTEGKTSFETMFTKAGNFIGGFAKVKPYKKYGLIDKTGNEVVPTEYDLVYNISDGLVRFKKDKLFGFYVNGAPVINPTFDKATDFHDNIAAARIKGEWSFIDKKGNTLRSLDYDQVEYGNEGYWMVTKNRLFGMINQDGEEVIPCEYKMLYKYKEGRCAYSVDGYWGFFDNKGNKITEPRFALVWDYNNGYARALAREGLIILDSEANVRFISPSVEMRDFEEGLAPIQYMN